MRRLNTHALHATDCRAHAALAKRTFAVKISLPSIVVTSATAGMIASCVAGPARIRGGGAQGVTTWTLKRGDGMLYALASVVNDPRVCRVVLWRCWYVLAIPALGANRLPPQAYAWQNYVSENGG